MQALASDDLVAVVSGGWKSYGTSLGAELRKLLPRGHAAPACRPWALSDINLELRRGESLGIIGRNGAGKSTLLKVLAGVSPLTRGRYQVRGRLFPMIELNAGMHPDLTGRQNVHLLGAIMGFRPGEMLERMPEVERFCELGEAFDKPVWTYSSGMMARLGFAVAVNVDADVLLIDEVLTVGDFAFRRKCLERIAAMLAGGTTMILVSHNPYMIERMCDRALLLKEGRCLKEGPPAEVALHYMSLESEPPAARPSLEQGMALRPGTGQCRVRRIEVLDGEGRPVERVSSGEPVSFRLHLKVFETVREPGVAIRVVDANNTLVLSLSMSFDRRGLVLEEDTLAECRIAALPLMSGVYGLQVKISVGVTVDVLESAASFSVSAPERVVRATDNKGICFAEAVWSFQSERS